MKQFQLIVNGDDFGASKEVNEAIVRAFKEGYLTSCSLIVTGDAFDDAVRLARENEKLAVGIHLVSVKGKSVLPHSQIPSLVDSLGRFPDDPTVAGLKYYFLPKARLELSKELSAQFAKFASTGLKISHIDSHLHLHVHPVIFNSAVELAGRYGVTRMRVPEDDLWTALRFDSSSLIQKSLFAFIFRLLTRRMKKRLTERGFVFAERVYGYFQSGRMSEEYVLSVLERLRTKRSEIYFHPALYRDMSNLSPEQARCARELSLLLSGSVLERIDRLGIKLTTYCEMERSP